MNKEKQKPALSGAEGLIPELRFPEFENDEGWIDSTIEEISLISSGGTPSRAKPEYWNGDIPWVSTTLIDYNKIKTANEFITELGLNNSSTKMFPKGTILMAMYGQGKTRGKVAVLDFNASINQACAAISLKKGINIEFVFQNLSARYQEIREISNEGGQKNLSSTLIKKIPFSHPKNEKEQQKIANCLSALDTVITAETDKLENLKDHKKGLLQQLFPANGETKPQFRFAEFENDGDWEEIILDDLGEIVTGKTPSTKNQSLWNGEILFITPTDISEKKYQPTTKRTIKNTAKIKLLPIGSIVYTCIASIGKIAVTTKLSISNQQINSIVPFEKYNGEFIYYLLVNLTPFIKSIPATSTLAIINKTEFSKIICKVPAIQEEQQKIADCLTSVDDLIEAQTTKIEALKKHKKGLMQQLFPNV